ncbi:MAG TPA: RNB domain-containing ribonuclease [Candidatus Angelobacter sp.]|jgi:exoribonuclease-2|nr:RNB domain-containing ribonuclease [Candidatus Angelobacter sp.]
MPNHHAVQVDLQEMARQAMLEHGFEPEYPAEVHQQVAELKSHPPKVEPGGDIRDLRDLLWSSIDNDTSKDLDQIEVAERLSNGDTKVLVGVADVDAFVARDTPIDRHAYKETTTVYTHVRNFHMLPEELSTGDTSLLEGVDKLSIVVEYVVSREGDLRSNNVYRAVVRNKAQLAYNSVGAWLEGRAAAPPKVAASADLQSQLKLQDEVAQALRNQRFSHGALTLESSETHPVLVKDQIVDVARQEKNHATELIEDFMVASNHVVATLLKDVPSLRRIVKVPERWDRIVELANQKGFKLPAKPDSKSLNDFLIKMKTSDPDHFVDLSLAVVKLMGPGEYVLERPGEPEIGHFGLAVQDYTHSTAPNRRFPDVVTQRLVKAVLAHQRSPYTDSELSTIAQNCTIKGDEARRVEREMSKRIAAVVMSDRIGEVFDAIVTGAGSKGTFVRALTPHIEGMLVRGQQGADVGDRLRVRLISTDIRRGYIDFARVH